MTQPPPCLTPSPSFPLLDDTDYRCLLASGSSSCMSSSSGVDPYEVLQIRRDATPLEIRESYRRLALWHHPGRYRQRRQHNQQNNDDRVELERRSRIFHVLAACYETLLDNSTRQRYDKLFHKQQQQQPGGVVLVAGKLWKSPKSRPYELASYCDDNPCLLVSPTDTNELPALALTSSSSSSSSSSSLSSYNSMAQEGTGPMALMLRARRGHSFSDPFVMFDGVFGSRLYPHYRREEDGASPPSPSKRQRPQSAAWTGSSRALEGGGFVSRTSRILQDRVLTRTEHTTLEPDGTKRTRVTISSEDVRDIIPSSPDRELENEICCSCCSHCGDNQSEKTESSSSSWKETILGWRHIVCACGELFPE